MTEAVVDNYSSKLIIKETPNEKRGGGDILGTVIWRFMVRENCSYDSTQYNANENNAYNK